MPDSLARRTRVRGYQFSARKSTSRQVLADQMRQYRTGFVKDADPRSASGPRSPRVSATSGHPLPGLDTPAPTRAGFAAGQCAFRNGSRP